jgi:hypothetical protein
MTNKATNVGYFKSFLSTSSVSIEGFLENQEGYGRILQFFLEKYCASWTARHTQILEGTVEEKNLPRTIGHTQNLGTFQGKK